MVDGLPLFHGAQVTVDTLVSPLRQDGTPHSRCANVDGAALDTARRRKETTYTELHGRNDRTRLVVLGAEVGGVCPSVGQGQSERGASNSPQSGPTGVDTQVVVFHPGCSVAKSLALLLERRGGFGADGATPSTSEVIGDARHLCA